MPRSKKSANPFYALLLVTGIAFAITAMAYGVMALQEARAGALDQQVAGQQDKHPLIDWMSRHGNTALITELAFLAVFTFGAIGTDDYWQRRAAAENKRRGRESFAAGGINTSAIQPAAKDSRPLSPHQSQKTPDPFPAINDQFSSLLEEDRRTRRTPGTG